MVVVVDPVTAISSSSTPIKGAISLDKYFEYKKYLLSSTFHILMPCSLHFSMAISRVSSASFEARPREFPHICVHRTKCWPRPDYGPMEVQRSKLMNGIRVACASPMGAPIAACTIMFQCASDFAAILGRPGQFPYASRIKCFTSTRAGVYFNAASDPAFIYSTPPMEPTEEESRNLLQTRGYVKASLSKLHKLAQPEAALQQYSVEYLKAKRERAQALFMEYDDYCRKITFSGYKDAEDETTENNSDRQSIAYTLRCPVSVFCTVKYYLLDIAASKPLGAMRARSCSTGSYVRQTSVAAARGSRARLPARCDARAQLFDRFLRSANIGSCRAREPSAPSCSYNQWEIDDRKPMIKTDLQRIHPEQLCMDLACWGGPLNNSIFCEEERIDGMSESSLNAFTKENFTTDECTVSSVGLPFEELSDDPQSHCCILRYWGSHGNGGSR
ncbi:hypothetical protein MSG28_012105 [Choristoneura fumiferana]|uniref:Uncharacterized protein n=2 Tax=Choristoneura fumiferana TaxID=7141 RepID=A0ACC0KBW2_CHOFU|nr:hypothetical protein MSG28_012105 [Choristoneura fumiferana]